MPTKQIPITNANSLSEYIKIGYRKKQSNNLLLSKVGQNSVFLIAFEWQKFWNPMGLVLQYKNFSPSVATAALPQQHHDPCQYSATLSFSSTHTR